MPEGSKSKLPKISTAADRRIVIIGAASGIGAHCAFHFATAHNAQVALLDPDQYGLEAFRCHLAESHPSLFHPGSRPRSSPLDYISGDQLMFITTDYTSEHSLTSSIQLVLARWHGIDGLLNNPGGGPLASFSGKSIEETSLEEFNRIVGINLSAQWLAAKHCVGELTKTAGSIVAIASTRAQQSEPFCEAYAASKGGVVALTHALASSFSKRRVRVNAISTGWIDVRDARMTEINRFPGAQVASLRTVDHRQHWVGRVGVGEDVARLAWFLLDSTQSGFIDGQDYVLDGGMSKKMKYA